MYICIYVYMYICISAMVVRDMQLNQSLLIYIHHSSLLSIITTVSIYLHLWFTILTYSVKIENCCTINTEGTIILNYNLLYS